MRLHYNIKVYGLVQGVFFRASVQNEAQNLSITGFAQNEQDESVYIEAEGEKNNLNKFIKWCNIGPSMSEVEKVVVNEDKLKHFTSFEVH